MNKKIGTFTIIALLSVFICTPLLVRAVDAKDVSLASLQEMIEELQKQIQELQAKIAELKNKIQDSGGLTIQKEEREEIKEQAKNTLRLTRYLRRGMRGEDIETLQEFLATDPEVYPEGLVTGYFGPLTQRAVVRFQKMAGIDQIGIVGPRTRSRINELLEEGAGESGKVPPGLLISPGIRKKLGFAPQVPPEQELPPGIAKKVETDVTSTPDTTPPVITDLIATSTTATSVRISWITDEESDTRIWRSTSSPVDLTTSTCIEVSSDLVLNHDVVLSGLNSSTTYYYVVGSKDQAGNEATSTERLFTTQ